MQDSAWTLPATPWPEKLLTTYNYDTQSHPWGWWWGILGCCGCVLELRLVGLEKSVSVSYHYAFYTFFYFFLGGEWKCFQCPHRCPHPHSRPFNSFDSDLIPFYYFCFLFVCALAPAVSRNDQCHRVWRGEFLHNIAAYCSSVGLCPMYMLQHYCPTATTWLKLTSTKYCYFDAFIKRCPLPDPDLPFFFQPSNK